MIFYKVFPFHSSHCSRIASGQLRLINLYI